MPVSWHLRVLMGTSALSFGSSLKVMFLTVIICMWWGILGIWLLGGLNHARCFDTSLPADQCCNYSDLTVTNETCQFLQQFLQYDELPCGTKEVLRCASPSRVGRA